MSKRFPPADAKDSSASSERIGQKLHDMYGGKAPSFEYSLDGEVVGCYTPLLYSPGMIDGVMDVSIALYKPSTLQGRLRELAILGLCSIWDMPYVQYCHILNAKQVGFSVDQIAAAIEGQVAKDLTDSEKMAYKLGRTLAAITGPLDDATWNEVSAHLSRQEIAGVAHVIGAYKWVSSLAQVNDGHDRWRKVCTELLEKD